MLATAVTSASYFAANVKASLSIPSFFDNFDLEKGVLSNADMDNALIDAIAKLVD